MALRKETKSTDKRIDGFLVNAVDDFPDFRDFAYRPALVQLRAQSDPPAERKILDQGQEGACTGFGLAAVINLLLARQGKSRSVSPRMLYEMARKYDEWKGEDYSGSSCRGAIRGWHSMGVCSDERAPYHEGDDDWALTVKQAKDARATTVGAYYRVSKRLSDYHAALNEVGVLFASARVHSGWKRNSVKEGEIPFRSDPIGGHAFAIVGYNDRGFWVQNSWGQDWGDNGIALWLYEDWLENVRDAWVVRLALSTPQIWHLTPTASQESGTEKGLFTQSPKRAEIAGHFVHLDDGDFDDKGKYWTDLATVRESARCVVTGQKYEHLLLYAHGGLNSIKASARRIVAMKETFKANGIYPFHFMYDTGLLEEIKDLVLGKKSVVEGRAGGLTDFSDQLVERATRQAGRAIWREMKRGACRPFKQGGAGTLTIDAFVDELAKSEEGQVQVHMVGHSTGAILLASLLEALGRLDRPPRVRSCLLMAPACAHKVFNEVYRPLLKERSRGTFGIDRMRIYNLEPELELDDTVTPLYRKSLLYLVSNAFEEHQGERILGMQVFRNRLGRVPGERIFDIHTSDGSTTGNPATASKTHGGFDNDVHTMNHVLRTILAAKPEVPFTPENLEY